MDESSQESSGERTSPEADHAKDPAIDANASGPAAFSGDAPARQAAEDSVGENGAAGGRLPVVWAPRRDAGKAMGEDSAFGADETISPAADHTIKEGPAATATAAAAPAASRSLRLALLAATVALAGAFGAVAGALSASRLAHVWPAAATRSAQADAGGSQAMKAQVAELATLKANLDSATHGANSQLAKITERLDRIERAQGEPAAKLAHMAEAIDRLEKRGAAAPEVTGTIAAGEPPAAETKAPERVLPDWVVQDVRGGRALVESRYGALFAVAAGNVIPGLGRVETIKRRDGGWAVVTAGGTITSTGR